ncbi:MAG: hypothetical protein HC888_01100 [Candidatus Competibacteraceae bacterium]|nr:hypothetical protein [Candidatus Competibacteraceae bacterium]
MNAKNLIDTIVKMSNGRFITVTFTKLNGDERTINGRLGVRWLGKPSGDRMDSGDREYLLVWDVRSRGFRRVAVDTIKRVATQNTVIFAQ